MIKINHPLLHHVVQAGSQHVVLCFKEAVGGCVQVDDGDQSLLVTFAGGVVGEGAEILSLHGNSVALGAGLQILQGLLYLVI